MSGEIGTLLALHLILIVELVDLFGILSISLAKVLKLILQMLLLSKQLGVEVLMLQEIRLESRNLHVSAVQSILLGIKLCVEVSVLLLAVDQEVLLVIDLLTKGRNHVDVGLDAGSVIVLHSTFLISDTVEALLEVEKLVLKILVLSLTSAEVHGLLSQLGDESILVVLARTCIKKLPWWAFRHCYCFLK